MTVSQLVDECHICRRPRVSVSEFCSLHAEAMKNLEDGYEKWRTAFGQEIAREDYFGYLLRLQETGAAVKEVIGYIQRKPSGVA